VRSMSLRVLRLPRSGSQPGHTQRTDQARGKGEALLPADWGRPASRLLPAGDEGLADSWIARRYLGAAKYETAALGATDDVPEVPADGISVLTFDQAQRATVEWSRQKAAAVRAAVSGAAIVTVRSAVDAYVATRKARAAKAGRDAELGLHAK